MHPFLSPIRYAWLAILLATTVCPAAEELPNIVIIYADDLGYGDLSCYNPQAAYKTPRLDRMAQEGIRFTDAHSPSTICSPSRYGLYSGQLVCRTGRRSTAFEGPGGPSYLAPGQLTIAEMLRKTRIPHRRLRQMARRPDLVRQGWKATRRRLRELAAYRLRQEYTSGRRSQQKRL